MSAADPPAGQDIRQAVQAARRLHRTGGGTVLDILLRAAGMPLAALAQRLGVAGVEVLSDDGAWQADFSRLDLGTSRQLAGVCLRPRAAAADTGADMRLALADPWDDDKVRRACAKLGTMPPLVAARGAQLEGWLGAPLQAVAGERERDSTRSDAAASGAAGTAASGPVVDFVDAALRAAYQEGASDVHFECDRGGVTVKLRHDGVMNRFARLDDPRLAEEVVSRIKVLAQLDITERRTPQDGRFRFAFGAASVDLRVSIMPSVFGEDAVLRLLDKAQLRGRDDAVTLDRLGFATENAERIRELALLPHGMLLVTGPTGSGKTTTVYALLSEVNTGLEKIITIEDPVEYELPGVLQIPVNERKGLTFAKGLRSILRHDPDRILVGEIRDPETAEIAVQSALTGHQVFTTIHANSLFDVTGRFRHFKLDMFGFMSSLNGVIVQRLVRRVCTGCAGTRPLTERERRWLATLTLSAEAVPAAAGCARCHGSGYQGRSVIAEVHTVDDRLRDLVTAHAPMSELRAHVAASGTVSLQAAAAALVLSGLTTGEEIRRVVGWQ